MQRCRNRPQSLQHLHSLHSPGLFTGPVNGRAQHADHDQLHPLDSSTVSQATCRRQRGHRGVQQGCQDAEHQLPLCLRRAPSIAQLCPTAACSTRATEVWPQRTCCCQRKYPRWLKGRSGLPAGVSGLRTPPAPGRRELPASRQRHCQRTSLPRPCSWLARRRSSVAQQPSSSPWCSWWVPRLSSCSALRLSWVKPVAVQGLALGFVLLRVESLVEDGTIKF